MNLTIKLKICIDLAPSPHLQDRVRFPPTANFLYCIKFKFNRAVRSEPIYLQSMTSNCHTFFLKKLNKSVTIWEHLRKRYYYWTIIKQQREKVWQFEVMDCIKYNRGISFGKVFQKCTCRRPLIRYKLYLLLLILLCKALILKQNHNVAKRSKTRRSYHNYTRELGSNSSTLLLTTTRRHCCLGCNPLLGFTDAWHGSYSRSDNKESVHSSWLPQRSDAVF